MDDSLEQSLSSAQAQLWQQYLTVETQGLRKSALLTLTDFVQSLQADSEARRQKFAETFCRQMADDGKPLPLRQPLFANIIGPYLVSAYYNGEKNAGRWLAYFALHFWKMPPSQKLIDLVDSLSPISLLTDAFRLDPDDVRTREMLIGKLANQFEYAVHEVPSGVMQYEYKATVTDSQKWLIPLTLFREVVQKHDVVEEYAEKMRYWDFHFRGYADYLTNREQYEYYEDYIEKHWQE